MMLVMMLIKPSCFLTILLGGGTSQPKTYKIYTKNISHYYTQGGRKVPRHTPYSYPIKKTAPGIFFNCPGLQSGQSGLCTCHFDTITRICDRIGVDCCCYGSRGFFWRFPEQLGYIYFGSAKNDTERNGNFVIIVDKWSVISLRWMIYDQLLQYI